MRHFHWLVWKVLQRVVGRIVHRLCRCRAGHQGRLMDLIPLHFRLESVSQPLWFKDRVIKAVACKRDRCWRLKELRIEWNIVCVGALRSRCGREGHASRYPCIQYNARSTLLLKTNGVRGMMVLYLDIRLQNRCLKPDQPSVFPFFY